MRRCANSASSTLDREIFRKNPYIGESEEVVPQLHLSIGVYLSFPRKWESIPFCPSHSNGKLVGIGFAFLQ